MPAPCSKSCPDIINRIRENKILLAEYGFVILSLACLAEGFILLVLTGGASEGDGNLSQISYPVIQATFLGIFLTTAFLLTRSNVNIARLLIKDTFILLFFTIAVASIFWSAAPMLTLRRVVALAGTILFGLYFGTRFSIKGQLNLLCIMFFIVILLSFLFVFVFPAYGIMGGPIHAGTWRGIFAHKNTLGRTMAASLTVFLLLLLESKISTKYRFFLYSGLVLSNVLLIFSTSKAALLNTIVILAILLIYLVCQHLYRIAIITSVIFMTVSLGSYSQVFPNFYSTSVISNIISNLIKIHKKTTLTADVPSKPLDSSTTTAGSSRSQPDINANIKTFSGRTELWSVLIKMAAEHPWFGYGYGVFWRSGTDGPSANVYKVITRWTPVHAHNGFIDLFLSVGVFGSSIFVIHLLINVARATYNLNSSKDTSRIWPFIYIIYLIVLNFTESSLTRPNQLFLSLYVAVSCSILVNTDSRLKSNPDLY